MAAVEQAAKTRTDWICAYVGPLVARDQRNWRKALDLWRRTRRYSSRVFGDTPVSSIAKACAGSASPKTSPIRWAAGGAATKTVGSTDGPTRRRDDHAAHTTANAGRLATAFGEAQQRYARWGVTSIHLMNNDKSLEVTLAGLAIAKPVQKWTVYSWGAWKRRQRFRTHGQ